MGKVSIAMDESKWQSEDDSRTLIRYAELKSDAKRYKAALDFVKKEQDKLSKIVAEDIGGK